MQTYVYMYQYISTKLHIHILEVCISKFLYYVATYGEGQTAERSGNRGKGKICGKIT